MNLKKILSLITSIAFCICCVSFTGSNAEENYEDEDDVQYSYDCLGAEEYVIEGKDFCNNIWALSDPQGSFVFSSVNDNRILKMTAENALICGKLQFSTADLSLPYFVREEYNYIKIRMKYDSNTYLVSTDTSYLLEGYSAESDFHQLGNVAEHDSGEWFDMIVPIEWTGNANNHRSILTFQPIRSIRNTPKIDFYIDYIGFFKTEEAALNYKSYNEQAIFLTAEDFLRTNTFDPDGILYHHEELSPDGAYTMEFTQVAKTGKMQFDFKEITGYDLDKSKYNTIKIRYKYDFAEYIEAKSTLREGYTSEATHHPLFTYYTGDNNIWFEETVTLDWGTSDMKSNTFTFHPVRDISGVTSIGDKFYIDYIAFFTDETSANEYTYHRNQGLNAVVLTANDLINSAIIDENSNFLLSPAIDSSVRISRTDGSICDRITVTLDESKYGEFDKDIHNYIRIRYKISDSSSLMAIGDDENNLCKKQNSSNTNEYIETVSKITWTDSDSNTLYLYPVLLNSDSEIQIDYIAFLESYEKVHSFDYPAPGNPIVYINLFNNNVILRHYALDEVINETDISPIVGTSLHIPDNVAVRYYQCPFIGNVAIWNYNDKWFAKIGTNLPQGNTNCTISKMKYKGYDRKSASLIYEIVLE